MTEFRRGKVKYRNILDSEGRETFGSDHSSVSKRRSLHSPQNGALLTGDRTRYAGDVTHDYTNVHGWNLRGKQKGC
ncbi:hypothetical protein AALA78_02845 [Lachnospiraceae bacterium 42-17]|jgi:hypothetical protein